MVAALFWWVCTYMCCGVCMCVHCGCVYVFRSVGIPTVCRYEWRPYVNLLFSPQEQPPFLLRQSLLLMPGLTSFARPAGLWASAILLLLPPQNRDHRRLQRDASILAFPVLAWDQIQVFILTNTLPTDFPPAPSAPCACLSAYAKDSSHWHLSTPQWNFLKTMKSASHGHFLP